MMKQDIARKAAGHGDRLRPALEYLQERGPAQEKGGSTMKDGGQAFPHRTTYEGYGGVWKEWPKLGMTLRDYFAGQALAGFVIKYAHQINTEGITQEAIAGQAYMVADAMLLEREKKEDREGG
jgi:hypothetical protein